MEPIIDPMFFYWVGVARAAVPFFVVAATAACVMSIALVGLRLDLGLKPAFGWPNKLCLVFAGVLAVLAVLTPTEDTLYKMAAAKMVTSESIEKVLKGGKLMKDELKRDLIDVIMSVKGEGDKK